METSHFKRLSAIADEVYDRLNSPEKKREKKKEFKIDPFIGLDISDGNKLIIESKYSIGDISYAALQVLKMKKRFDDNKHLLDMLKKWASVPSDE